MASQNQEIENLKKAERRAEDAERRAAEAEKRAEDAERRAEDAERRLNGTYWHCIGDVWERSGVSFRGGLEKFENLRSTDNLPENYKTLVNIYNQGEGTETVLLQENDIISVATSETNSISAHSRHDSAGTSNHMKKHLKTLSGRNVSDSDKSKAHIIPDDKSCNQFWGPVLAMALGDPLNADEKIMKYVTRMHTNKLVFDNHHNGIFDTLSTGNVIAIPIFESVTELGQWQYQNPYELLIVCDRSETYQTLQINGSEDHVISASDDDVRHATGLLTETTKMLAESLQENWVAYETFDESTQKTRMKKMRDKLSEGEVFVPVLRKKEDTVFNLYKISFGKLFFGESSVEERKYIPDPFLLLVKAAVNFSAVAYGNSTKLLQACTPASSEESGDSNGVSLNRSRDTNTTMPPQGTSGIKALPSEIRIVSDDEEESVSVCSDVTYVD